MLTPSYRYRTKLGEFSQHPVLNGLLLVPASNTFHPHLNNRKMVSIGDKDTAI